MIDRAPPPLLIRQRRATPVNLFRKIYLSKAKEFITSAQTKTKQTKKHALGQGREVYTET